MSGAPATSPVDPRIVRLAERSKNFGFLLPHAPLLVVYGAGAESAVFGDPNTSMVKVRQFGEVLAADLVRRGHVRLDGGRQVDRLRALNREGYLHGKVGSAFDELRTVGDDAVHNHAGDPSVAFHALTVAFRLGVWFDRLLTGSREVRAFVPPQPINSEAESDTLRQQLAEARQALEEARTTFAGGISQAEAERRAREAVENDLAAAHAERERMALVVEELREQLDTLRASFDDQLETHLAKGSAAEANREQERLLSNAQSASREPLTELQVRERLDCMLREAGWSVQDNDNRLNLWRPGDQRGQGVAVREVVTSTGRADYLLYTDGQLVGVIEAKREGADLSAAESQADHYARSLTPAQQRFAWRSELPFRYASDGGETRFRNALDPDSRTRSVFSIHQPRTLARWMRQADEDRGAPTYRSRLRTRMPELITANLRPAQAEAVRGVEDSLAAGRGQAGLGQPRALIQMATGAGKTYTAVTFSYRLLKHAKAERILFLVDRNNLGVQAQAEFENYVTPDTNRVFTELYNVQRLAAGPMAPSSKVVVSTVQRLYRSLTGGAEIEDESEDGVYDVPGDVAVNYNPDLPPESFDLVIVDECHRSIYGKWRSVLEYFDAMMVGLTATPVAQTFGYFNRNLVSEYSYEDAVADGVNVPFNVFRIGTEITKQGGTILKGVVPVRDRRTRRQRYEDLDDDVQYTANEVGSRVIAKDQIRTVMETFHKQLFTDIFPERAKHAQRPGRLLWDEIYVPKTLIFAKDDNHAEEIVEVVRDVFGKGNDFCAKITHAASRPAERLANFRNNAILRIAVTVDMIATGTDVKPLECLLFLRDVRSWAYFEQMKGRGSRTLKQAEFERVTPGVGPKTRFVIVDAVGVTEKPKIDASPTEKHTERQISLERLLKKTANGTVEESEISTLSARLAKLNLQLEPAERDEVEREAGEPLTAIVRRMTKALSVDEQEAARESSGKAAVRTLLRGSVHALAANENLRTKLLELRRAKDILYDENSRDRLLFAGPVEDDEESARQTIREFRTYIKEHVSELALFSGTHFESSVTPREVFQRLQELARSLERPPRAWTPDRLWRSYEQIGEAEATPGGRHGVADLVALFRYELAGGAETGQEPVQPYATQVEQRFANWLARQQQSGASFNEEQLWWLRRIAEATAARVRFDFADLDYPPFSSRNGTFGFLAAFGENRADEIIDELDRELTA